MDDTQQSRASDAGATRKRRSSILKSHRPARTPFSELEFNAATPTDTAKSRRVSFSKRTGIAEFVTNEATTTWKTFYEEHNKSLESSGNDSDVNASRQPGHLGKRIFSQQFEEFEAVGFLGPHNPPINANMSLHNINFTEQIASLECIPDGKLTAPEINYELSAITDHQSKLFGNDFTVTGIGEMSGRIAVNFSAIQQIPEGDDLDEIERDLGRVSNVVCVGPKDCNTSEYIEVDLNMTHVMKNKNDISITDQNSKVQDLAKYSSIDKIGGVNKDWIADKENIAINPYVTPCDADNFAINDERNKVLVFDGKRLTLEIDKPEKVFRKTLLPDALTATPQRKTIFLNTNDDLPNFADDLSSKNEVQYDPNILYNDLPLSINNRYEMDRKTNIGEISFTQALPSVIVPIVKHQNTDFEEELYDISLTQPLSTNIITDSTKANTHRRSVVDHNNDSCNISLTQELPINIMENDNFEKPEKRKTMGFGNMPELDNNNRISIVLEENKCEIPLSANAPWKKANAFLLSGVASNSKENIQTIEPEKESSVEVQSMAKVQNIKLEESYNNKIPIVKDIGELIEKRKSSTQSGVTNLREQQRTIVSIGDKDADMSITEAIPKIQSISLKELHSNLIPIVKNFGKETENRISSAQYGVTNSQEHQRTIVYTDDSDADMSITRAIPKIQNIFSDVLTDDRDADMSITKAVPKVHNIFSDVPTDNINTDMSITKAVPKVQNVFSDVPTDIDADMSITKAVPKVQNIFSDVPTDNIDADMSITKAVPKVQNIFSDVPTDDIDADMSITKAVPKVQNIFSALPTDDIDADMSIIKAVPKVQNIFSDVPTDDIDADMSITKAVPKVQNIFSAIPTYDIDADMSIIKAVPKVQNIFSDVPTDDIDADMSITKAVLKVQNIFSNVHTDDIDADMSITKAVPKVQNIFSAVPTDDIDADMSITKAVPKVQNIISAAPTDDMNADMSITKAISKVQNIFSDVPTNDRYADMSITESIPEVKNIFTGIITDNRRTNIFIAEAASKVQNKKLEDSHNNEIPIVDTIREISEKQTVSAQYNVIDLRERQRTIVIVNNEDANVFLTEVIPEVPNIKIGELQKKYIATMQPVEDITEKQIIVTKVDDKQERTIMFTEDSKAEIFITETIPKLENITMGELNRNEISTVGDPNLCEQHKSIILANDRDADMSKMGNIMKEELDKSIIPIVKYIKETTEKETNSAKVDTRDDVINLEEKQKTVIDNNEISITETVPELIIGKSNKSEIPELGDVNEAKQTRINNIGIVEGVANLGKHQENMISTDNNVKKISNTENKSQVENKLEDLENRLEEKNKVEFVNKSFGNPSISKPIPTDVMFSKHDQMDTLLITHLDLSMSKNANDTKALLDMISHFTDDSLCNDSPTSLPPILTKTLVATEDNEPKIHELKRLSFASNRQSIVISREDMLNSISMAKAVLQKSQMNLDESSLSDDSQEHISEDYSNEPRKPLRISREAVKTLHFDDESINETNIKLSPLRKTAFGETSYMMDSMRKRECNKVKVIPTYDVADGIKELMSDLVKPMIDLSPYIHIEHKGNNNNSIVTKELQANLATSSQIDMDIDLPSNRTSDYELGRKSYCLQPTSHSFNPTEDNNASQKVESCLGLEVNGPESIFTPLNKEDKNQVNINGLCSTEQPEQDTLIVFDQENPLNNVLIRPVDNAFVHKYDPIKVTVPQLLKSDETICGSTYSESCQIDVDKNVDESKVKAIVSAEKIQENLTSKDSISNQSKAEILRPESRDCSVDACLTDVKDTEVNTIIAMKGNTELLAVNSSLTLVDETINTCSKTTSSNDCYDRTVRKSPLRVIFQVDEQESSSNIENLESDTTCTDEDINMTYVKAKKRIHIPATPTKNLITNIDVTPKPCIKMQKLSLSPKVNHIRITPEKDIDMPMNQTEIDIDRTQLKKSPKKCKDTISNSITVQQLLTDYNVDYNGGINESALNKQILKALQSSKSFKSDKSDASSMITSRSDVCSSVELANSFTSSKNFNARKFQSDCSPQSSSKISCQPELCSLDSITPVSDSGVNIVAKIDMLPFMGTQECEWDSSSGDTWCFRLLHGRIRLIIRLEHRHDNAIRTRVRADTPIVDVKVETVHQDKKNIVANLCVRFACETMRYMVKRGGCVAAAVAARDVPSLLRHSAAVARIALRWGRAMHDAKLHLAYTLDAGGHLALKVANIPLRSVWEVNMDLELVVEDANESPWPRASNVRVTRIVSDVIITAGEVQRVMSHIDKDWGHVPRTLWRIFRYLKHKTLDDALLLGA